MKLSLCLGLLATVACSTRQDQCLALVGRSVASNDLGEPPAACNTPRWSVTDCDYSTSGTFSRRAGPYCSGECCANPSCISGCSVDCAAEKLEGVTGSHEAKSYSRSGSDDGRPSGTDTSNYGRCTVYIKDSIVISALWRMET